jgi:hypothetical protein
MRKLQAIKTNVEALEEIFNEWNSRYADNPELFSEQLDEDGKPVDDYGKACAIYFMKLCDELNI